MKRLLRLSAVEAEILRLLIANGELYGLALVAAAPKIIKRGSVYVTLGRMADKGLVTSRAVEVEHEPGMPRRLFAPTGLGEKVFRAWETADAILREAWA
jgi:DNA-binding PadR family transcriptional regulator